METSLLRSWTEEFNQMISNVSFHPSVRVVNNRQSVSMVATVISWSERQWVVWLFSFRENDPFFPLRQTSLNDLLCWVIQQISGWQRSRWISLLKYRFFWGIEKENREDRCVLRREDPPRNKMATGAAARGPAGQMPGLMEMEAAGRAGLWMVIICPIQQSRKTLQGWI